MRLFELIPVAYRLIAGRVLLAIVFGAAFALAWHLQAWRYTARLEHQAAVQMDALNQHSQAALRREQAEQEKRLALERQLSASDQQHARELSDAQRDQGRLRDRLATADVRLSVLLDAAAPASDCSLRAAAPSGSVVHGTQRAELDPAHAQRIIGITDSGDSGLIALRACQAYVRAIVR
ncbi:lysis system i-spanin subunit Rz [Pseudomonas mucidolens]|uniref:lysis system i-spanin subunit Rz n=1 Tax=Pseudomonas mucidolens TaxID=46679 RepID=UPI0030DB331B